MSDKYYQEALTVSQGPTNMWPIFLYSSNYNLVNWYLSKLKRKLRLYGLRPVMH